MASSCHHKKEQDEFFSLLLFTNPYYKKILDYHQLEGCVLNNGAEKRQMANSLGE